MVCCWDEPPCRIQPFGMATLWDKHFLSVSPCPVSGEGLLQKMDGIFFANSVSTAQMAHCEMQLAPRRCSNHGGQEHAERRLSLGGCERGVSRRRWKSAKSGYSVQKLSNWRKSSWVRSCKRHCSLESSHVLPCLFRRSKACNWSQQMQGIWRWTVCWTDI